MGRFFAGIVAALMLLSAGLFWWQDRAELATQPLVAQRAPSASLPNVPPEGDPDAVGAALPALPKADARSREEKRFDRYDRDRNNIITRAEMMGSRVKAFKALDKDGNNLLSFEEWAVRTSDRFSTADANRDGRLSRAEFATTAPKPAVRKPVCACDD
ncbi:hypothetical protein [Sphingobium sp. CR28]|uniref:hypothetical protein n=1 Tax=Sphingobium sp. CR28 TaxID=3400272 RepID=UPI003FF07A5F